MTDLTDSLRGRLLLATPTLRDPNFARTVVLVLEHNDEGAVGLVLNRPSLTPIIEVLPEWRALAAEPAVVFVGGPVSPSSAIALGVARPSPGGFGADVPGWQPLFGALGVVDLGEPVADVMGGVDSVRVFAGYAGWGAGQLDAELAANGWFVVDADAYDAVDPAPDDLWRGVLRREGGWLARYAHFPDDPHLN